MSTYPVTRATAVDDWHDRVIVDGVDVTWLRGKHTAVPGYRLSEPFAYSDSDPLAFPHINPLHEPLPNWARNGASVLYQRVDDAGTVQATDFRGLVTSVKIQGATLVLEVGGDLVTRAELYDKQPPLFRTVTDAGTMISSFVRYQLNRSIHHPSVAPQTGIELLNVGGMTGLGFLSHVCSQAQTRTGVQWTLMPVEWGGREWEFRRKDRDTIHATIFLDDARIVADLTDDVAEAPNTWFGTSITPDGELERNAKTPGLTQGPAPAYPVAGGATFGIGTQDSDTLTGDGISVLNMKLRSMNYLTRDPQDGYTQATADAVDRLREDAGLAETGTVTPTVWDALFDLTVTGYDLSGAAIFPVLQRSKVREWNYTANGSKASKNDAYDPSILPVHRTVDFGAGPTLRDMRDWFRGRQQLIADRGNWAGTIRLTEGAAAWEGEWNPGDTPPASAVLPARSIRPGMNVWLPFPGLVVHIGEAAYGGDVTLTVDTLARDALELSEIIERNRESRRSPRREWRRENRRGSSIHDGRIVWDSIGGWLRQDVACPANEWTVVPIPAGQQGTVGRIDLNTRNDRAAFQVVVIGDAPPGSNLQEKVDRLKGQLDDRASSPMNLNADGETVWDRGPLQDWMDARDVRYIAGSDDQPCGYWPRKHKNDAGNVTDAPITGDWDDRSGFEYRTATTEPVLYLCIWPDRATTLKAGHVLWKREEDSA